MHSEFILMTQRGQRPLPEVRLSFSSFPLLFLRFTHIKVLFQTCKLNLCEAGCMMCEAGCIHVERNKEKVAV